MGVAGELERHAPRRRLPGVPGLVVEEEDRGAGRAHLAGLGLRMLPNAHAVLARGEAALVLAGVTDASAPNAGQPGPDPVRGAKRGERRHVVPAHRHRAVDEVAGDDDRVGARRVGAGEAARVPPVVEREVVIPGLPPAFEGYRLLQLTDLHLSRLFPLDQGGGERPEIEGDLQDREQRDRPEGPVEREDDLVIARWLLPLSLPLAVKAALAVLLLAASQFHLWNRAGHPGVPRPAGASAPYPTSSISRTRGATRVP
jgi:hypothetical protein